MTTLQKKWLILYEMPWSISQHRPDYKGDISWTIYNSTNEKDKLVHGVLVL